MAKPIEATTRTGTTTSAITPGGSSGIFTSIFRARKITISKKVFTPLRINEVASDFTGSSLVLAFKLALALDIVGPCVALINAKLIIGGAL